VFCDGAAVGRKRYPALFRKLGTRCGAGDGTTTFNVPHFREQDTGTVRWVIKAEPTEQQLMVSFQISEFAQLALARPNLPAHLHQAAHFLESMVVTALDDA
jgi:microcystin-dependent protein